MSGLYGFSTQGAPVSETFGTSSGGLTTSPGGGSPPGAGSSTPPVAATVVKQPPRFRTFGIAIGDAIDVTPTNAVTFPLTLELHFNPQETAAKGVDPELIRVFFFDPASGTWSDRGLTVRLIDRTEGLVRFETTHLTVFRLGIRRDQPPLIERIEPSALSPGAPFVVWGHGFSLVASQNLLTIGGAFVGLPLDPSGQVRSLDLQDGGETLILQDASSHELDRAELSASPANGSSWVRNPEGRAGSPFVAHAAIASGRLFSPGIHANGDAFLRVRGSAPRVPSPGDLVINEALLAPPASFLGDANGDGETNPHEDEFVELVNATDHALLLDGCVLLTRAGERHRFPQGAVLPGGMAIVLFGVDDPQHPPLPAGPFGGTRLFPDHSLNHRLLAHLPAASIPGTAFLTVTTLRQTSNPVSFQMLAPLGDRLPAFEDGSSQVPVLANRQLRLLRVGDVDRDLDLDVVAVSDHSDLVLLVNDGFGNFAESSATIPLPDGRNQFFDLALADLTQDGAPELIIGDTDPAGSYTQLLVFENTGGGRFTLLLDRTGVLNSAASAGPTAFAVGDVDHDGDQDVVVAVAGDQPLLFRNDGTGHFSHVPGADVLPQAQVVVPSDIALADVDGDGDLDAILSAGRAGLGSSQDVQLFFNDGTGHFEDGTATHVPAMSEGTDALAIGDLDGDGDLDVASGSETRPPRIYLNDGTGRFTLGDASVLASVRASSILLEDLNGDGNLDLVFSHPPRDQVFLNNGHAIFSALPALPESSGNHRDAAALDVDEDGDLDLLSVGPGLALLRNIGTRANHPPQLESITEHTVMEGNLLTVEVRAHDTDGDALTLTTALRGGEPLSTLGASFADHGDGTGALLWTPSADQGSRDGRRYEFVARASDGLSTSEQGFTIVVKELNHPPVMTPLRPVTIEELVSVAIQLHADDPDADDVLTFGAVGLPAGATLSTSSGLFQWTPNASQGNGPGGRIDYPVTFTVTDLAHDSSNQEVTLTVLDVNHPPVFPLFGPQSILEGQALALDVGAQDPDGEAVTVSALQLPPGATFDGPTHTLHWTPTFTQARAEPYVARFQATDGHLTVTLDVPITVLDVNRPPAFVGLTDQAIEEGQSLVFDVVASDLDGDPLTLSVQNLPSGAAFNPANGHFVWVPGSGQAGDHLVTFGVSDAVTTVHQSIHITVSHVNHAPVLGGLQDQTIREGHLLQFAIDVVDADHDPLTVQVTPLPRGAQIFRQGGAWLFQWVPGSDQAGSYPLTVQVSDGLIPIPVTGSLMVNVTDNPGFQRVTASIGFIDADATPASGAGVAFSDVSLVTLTPGDSLVLDLGEVHPAPVSMVDLFNTTPAIGLVESDLALFISDDNHAYQAYSGPRVFSTAGNRLILSNLNIASRYIKIHRALGGGPQGDLTNILSEIARASGAIALDATHQAQLDDLAHRTFLYFAENVNANGLIPDRVGVPSGQLVPGTVYSTAATGFWLSALPIAVERGWVTRDEGAALARRTLEFYLGRNGGPVAGQFGFYYHFLNADGTRFTGFAGDGVSILDSTLLFTGALTSGQYFGGDINTLATDLLDRADWEQVFDHSMNMLRLFWTPEDGFIRHLDYYSEGILSYILAAGSTTHPVVAGPDLPAGADGYYAFSRGNYGRILGRFGRDGRPLLQSFFGSLFTYLYPPLLLDLDGARDALNTNWTENTREAILANFAFGQAHPEAGYGRLFWGISAADGPTGYQGLYGAPPLDPGAGGVLHDGTIAPYALAGSLPFAADLALPALQNLMSLQGGRLMDRYGLKGGVNLQQDFFDTDYLGLDEGALLLGLEEYQSGLVGQLVRQHPVVQRAMTALGMRTSPILPLGLSGPRSRHAYVLVDSAEHLTQTVQIARPALPASGDLLLELHPFGMDTARSERFVDVDLAINGQPVKTLRFADRRGTGVVDVGSVYVPIPPALLAQATNDVTLTWVGGERWLQLQDVELSGPTGRLGHQETWSIGQRDGSFHEFGDERLTNDSYLVGDDPKTFEQALNVVDEPNTDLLFELQDAGVDRLLRLVASETQNGQSVTVEVSVNDAVAGSVSLRSGGEATIDISRFLLKVGWNHIRLRHANVPSDGEFILWDTVAFERQAATGDFQVLVRNVQNDQLAPELQFGLTGPDGAVAGAQQYLEIYYPAIGTLDRVTISTDNRNAPIHQFTGPANASAAGLVGEVDSGIVAPLLWQVYDGRQPTPPAFTNTVEWAYVPDIADADFGSDGAINYRTLVSPGGLGDRPTAGRSATSPVVVYLAADFRGKPAQRYGTDRLEIEIIQQ